jgi:hypothetical protein
MNLQFPLFPPRRGDRRHGNFATEFDQCLLSIPSNPRGRIRLELKIPWAGPKTPLVIIPLALSWAKGVPLPSPASAAEEIWALLQSCMVKASRTGFVVLSTREIEGWTARIHIPPACCVGIPLIPPQHATLVLREALAWAARLLVGRWPSDEDHWRWIYRQHQRLALIVADEIAWCYLHNLPALRHPTYLKEASPDLIQRIREAYGLSRDGRSPRVTRHRLAFALVDVKFEHVLPRLLDYSRAVGLDDSKLWERVLPPKIRQTLRELCFGHTVVDLLEWPKEETEFNTMLNWVRGWWFLMVYSPLRPFDAFHFQSMPGVEDLAARVWASLHEL